MATLAGASSAPANVDRGKLVASTPVETGDLHRRWLDSELDRFSPWGETGVSWQQLQRFAELAIAYDVFVTSPLAQAAPRQRWESFLVSHLQDPAYGEWARSSLDMAWAILLPYLVMRRHGFADSYHDRTLFLSGRAGFPSLLEVVPYRAVDYAYFAERAGLRTTTVPSLDELLGRTFAGQAACRYLVDPDAGYALTHTIFYASEFGQASICDTPLVAAAPIVDTMIVDSCVNQRFDLLAELLICSFVLDGTTSFVRELGMGVLYQTLDGGGSLLPDGSVTERTFDACYHTTLVGMILCASLARLQS